MTLILCIILAFTVLIESCVLARVLKVFGADDDPIAVPEPYSERDARMKAAAQVQAFDAGVNAIGMAQKKETPEKPKPKPSGGQWVSIKNELEREVSE